MSGLYDIQGITTASGSVEHIENLIKEKHPTTRIINDDEHLPTEITNSLTRQGVVASVVFMEATASDSRQGLSRGEAMIKISLLYNVKKFIAEHEMRPLKHAEIIYNTLNSTQEITPHNQGNTSDKLIKQEMTSKDGFRQLDVYLNLTILI